MKEKDTEVIQPLSIRTTHRLMPCRRFAALWKFEANITESVKCPESVYILAFCNALQFFALLSTHYCPSFSLASLLADPLTGLFSITAFCISHIGIQPILIYWTTINLIQNGNAQSVEGVSLPIHNTILPSTHIHLSSCLDRESTCR